MPSTPLYKKKLIVLNEHTKSYNLAGGLNTTRVALDINTELFIIILFVTLQYFNGNTKTNIFKNIQRDRSTM